MANASFSLKALHRIGRLWGSWGPGLFFFQATQDPCGWPDWIVPCDCFGKVVLGHRCNPRPLAFWLQFVTSHRFQVQEALVCENHS